jgi:type II secretory pathway component PulC
MRSLLCTVLALSFACGGAAEPAKTPMASPVETNASLQAVPAGALGRGQVRQSVRDGLGMFLRTLEVEPAFREGAFIGFQLKSLRDPARWKGIDLKVGDVISRVNGQVIEHPEDALKAFKSCENAKQIQVVGERGGAPLNVTIPIVEDAL